MKFTKKLIMLSIFIFMLILTGCQSQNSKQVENTTKLNLVLDYVPNTNHTGIYVAQKKGYYKKAGISLKIIEPGQNNTSTDLVAANKAQFGVSVQEDVTYAKTAKKKLPVKAIATILQHNTSGFASLKKENIKTPKDFENKTYAGWQAPSESAVLEGVMDRYNGDFNKLKIVGSPGGGFADLGKKVDFEWFFEGWDNVKAQQAGVKLNYMPVSKLDKRLDYYTPLIIGNENYLKNHPKVAKKFLAATKKGYQFAIKHPEESAKILHTYAPENSLKLLSASQKFLSKNYTDNPQKWGEMKESTWNNYTDFMYQYKLIDAKVPAEKMFTNKYLGD